jgi:hypothetical protein
LPLCPYRKHAHPGSRMPAEWRGARTSSSWNPWSSCARLRPSAVPTTAVKSAPLRGSRALAVAARSSRQRCTVCTSTAGSAHCTVTPSRVQKDRAQCSQRSRPYSPAPSHSSTQLMAWSCHSVQSAERVGRAGGVTTRARACAKISAPSSSRSRRLELISSCHCRTQYLSICRRHTCAPVGHLPPESERSSCDANQNEARICAHAATGATQTRSSLSIRHAKGWAPAWTVEKARWLRS